MGRRERKREHLVAGALGDRQRRAGLEVAVSDLPVHGQDGDAGRRPDVAEPHLVLVARATGAGRVDSDYREMESVDVARVAGEGLDPVQPGDRGVVELEVTLP